MQTLPGQAAGLSRLFSRPQPLQVISVLASPNATQTPESTLALADALSARGGRVCLVEIRAGSLSALLGCRPLHGWQARHPPAEQMIVRSGAYRLLSAPGRMAGDAEIVSAIADCGQFDFLIFDGGNFSREAAAIDPETRQKLVLLMHGSDVGTVYAFHKGLCLANSPAHSMVLGGGVERVSQLFEHFLKPGLGRCKNLIFVYLNNNKHSETSSNTLRINSNLEWVVSRIQPGNEKRGTYAGAG